jgi:hypothetical protein
MSEAYFALESRLSSVGGDGGHGGGGLVLGVVLSAVMQVTNLSIISSLKAE